MAVLARPPALPALPGPQPIWEDPGAADESGLRSLLNTLLQYWKLVLALVLVALVVGIGWTVVAEPVYRVDTLLQMDDAARSQSSVPRRDGGASIQPPVAQWTAAAVNGEVEILRSRELLLRAVVDSGTDLDVHVDNRFPIIGEWLARRYKPTLRSSLADTPLGLTGFAWGGEKLELARFDLADNLFGLQFYVERQDAGWALLDADQAVLGTGAFGVDTTIKTELGAVTVRVDDIKGGARVRFAVRRLDPNQAYESVLERLKVAETSSGAGVIRLSIEDPDRAKATVLLDAVTSGYIARSLQARTEDTERSLAYLEQQMPLVKRDLERAEETLNKFRVTTSTVNIDQDSNVSMARAAELQRARIDLELRLRALGEKFGADHPDMRAARDQLALVNKQIAAGSAQLGKLPTNQRDFVRLQREVENNAGLYNGMQASVQELRASMVGVRSNARLVDAAQASSSPVRPRVLVVMSIALGAGVVAGLLAAALMAVVRPTIRDTREIESVVGLPALITVPDSPAQRRSSRFGIPFIGTAVPRLLTIDSPQEPAIEALRSFRMSLTYGANAPITKAILIASATPGVGKTFIAANLATLLASANRRVLVIEADMRHPRLRTHFRVPPGPGLADVLAGQARLDEVIQRDVAPMVDLLPPGIPTTNPADLLASPRLKALLEVLERQYDHIVFDSAPVLPVADSLSIAQLNVTTYIVARAERSTTRELQETTRRLDAVGAQVAGVVFNGAKRIRLNNLRYYSYFANNV
ncbi:polysaccharide biosynthesis tyrosine autokinase [soil metagenome]